MNKIPTGIEGFDQLVFGGLPKGRAYLLAGEPGTGKTIFSLQYLLEGAKNGEKVVYISIDQEPNHLILDAESLDWDLNPYLKNGSLKILDVTKYFESFKLGNAENLNSLEIIDDIRRFIDKEGVTRLAIDPVAPLVFNRSTVPEIAEYIRSLIFAIESSNTCTSILTSHVPVGSELYSQHGIEEFAASGIILMKLANINNKYSRTISIRKMRSTQIDLTEYSFDILTKRGVVLRQPV